MMRRTILAGGLVAASAFLLGGSSQASTSVTLSCTYHPEYELRKYGCSGTGVGYGAWYCSAYWYDSDSDGDWEEGNTRVISMSCTGATGSYSCSETAWLWYSCSGTGVYGSAYCDTYEWTDGNADPTPGTVTHKSGCTGASKILELIQQ